MVQIQGQQGISFQQLSLRKKTKLVNANNLNQGESMISILKRLRGSPAVEGEKIIERLCKNAKYFRNG